MIISRYLLTFFLIAFSFITKAQVTANFTPSETSHCTPFLGVLFTNNSTGPIISNKWYVDDIFKKDTVNFSYSFTNSGLTNKVFKVKLVVSDGTNKDSVTKDIIVFGTPKAQIAYNSPKYGCAGFTVQFSDNSIPAEVAITDWDWTFGDGGNSILQNPNHTYTNIGTYTVILQLTDANGCKNNVTHSDSVKVSDKPTVNFGPCLNQPSTCYVDSCAIPFNVNFTASCTPKISGLSLTYSWNFGDPGSGVNNTSAMQNPSHSYNSEADFDVRLTVTDEYGCTDNLLKQDLVRIDIPKANFTMPSIACKNIPVSFNNTSVNANTYSWDFGDTYTSTQTNPSHTYDLPGTFNVRLIAKDGASCPDTIIKQITVEEVTAEFSPEDTTVCVGSTLLVQFINLSSTNATSFYWNFGSSYWNFETPPVKTYSPGVYKVKLTATTANGCSHTDSTNVNFSPPIPVITASQTSGCVPFDVNFSAIKSTPNGTVLSYEWEVDGVDVGTGLTMNHTFNTHGSYNVELKIINTNGCFDSTTITIIGGREPIPGFIVPKDTICTGESITFTDTTIDLDNIVYNWVWSCTNYNNDTLHSDGNKITKVWGTQLDGTSSCGTKIISLTVSTSEWGCTQNIKDTIYVECVNANFTNDTAACKYPFNTTFENLSTSGGSDIKTWQWNNGQYTKYTYDSTSSVDFTYNYGTSISLTVTTEHNCKDYESKYLIEMEEPIANFTFTPPNGCKPLTVSFTDKSYAGKMKDSGTPLTIVSWQWDFGDPGSGVNNTSTLQNPTHIYNNAKDDYKITLTVTNDKGCTDSYDAYIDVGDHQDSVGFIFSYDKCDFSATKQVLLTDTTPGHTGKTDSYKWVFDTSNTEIGYSPYVKNFSDTLEHTVQMIIEYNGCYDTSMIDTLEFSSLRADIKETPFFDCSAPYYYGFISEIYNATALYWDFNGDSIYEDSIIFGKDTSHIDTMYYTYSARGDYWPVLKVVNEIDGCEFIVDSSKSDYYIYNDEVNVRDIKAVITVDKIAACAGTDIWIGADSSQDAVSYYWDYGDDTHYAMEHKYKSYSNKGTYDLYLRVTDMNGCTDDTTFSTIFISKITANFTVDDPSGCAPSTFNFTDLSISDTTIVYWEWSLAGDISHDTNPTYIKTNPGSYGVMLTVRDTIGCTGTKTIAKYVSVTSPIASFTVPKTKGCANKDVFSFNNTSKNYNGTSTGLSYVWDFGDYTPTSTQTNPSHTYIDSGHFEVKLVVSDVNGCKDSTDTIIYIEKINSSDIKIMIDDSSADCYPEYSIFTNYDSLPYITSRTWYMGDTNIIYGNNAQLNYKYSKRGTFTVKLVATTSNGCKDSVTMNNFITVSGPYVKMHVDKDTICKGEILTFIIDSIVGAKSYSIDFQDGSTIFKEDLNYQTKINDTAVVHQFKETGYIQPILSIETSNSDCKPTYDMVTPEVDIDIQIRNVVADFDITSNDYRDTIGCGYPFSFNFSDLSSGPPVEWKWAFGDGTDTVSQQNTSHIYNSSGTFEVKLMIENENDCKDTIKKQVVVREFPDVTIYGDTIICRNEDIAKIYATTIGTGAPFIYGWNPTDNLTFISNDTVTVAPNIDMTSYYVVVTDFYECKDTDFITIYIKDPLVLDSLYPNTTTEIDIGESVDLYANYINGMWYEWTTVGVPAYSGQLYHVTPTQTTLYFITVYNEDSICAPADTNVLVTVIKAEGTIDVPNAFTPGIGGANSIVKVRGKGITELIEFKIFNRWGQIVFETNNINTGWDGTYKGKMQSMDSYAYIARVKTERGDILTKEGYINLIR